jgi:protein-tyrosine phosphatase
MASTERITVRVLFVCMGNICRSPTAQGVFHRVVEEAGLAHRIDVDSAGTHGYHIGAPPDPRARDSARRRGIQIDTHRARRVTRIDMEEFDYVVAMDSDNLADLETLCPAGHEHKLVRLMDFAPHRGERDVPDPYYGGQRGFELVLDMVEEAARGLLERIRQTHGLR